MLQDIQMTAYYIMAGRGDKTDKYAKINIRV